MDKKIYCDVLVVGGGISGISAAYNCTKMGLKTILVEKKGYLGGLITGGLVIPSMKIGTEGINQRFFNDLVNYAQKMDAQITYGDGNFGWFNPVILKTVFDKMLSDVGCKVIFEGEPISFEKENKNIKYIKILSNNLSLSIYSKYYIDGTGNGSLSKLLGCKFLKDTKEKQASSLRFIVSGVDLDKLSEFLLKTDPDRSVTTSYKVGSNIHLSTAYTSNGRWALKPFFERAIKDKVLKKDDAAYFQIFTIAGMKNSVAFNCPRLKIKDNENIFSRSEAIIEGRFAIIRLHNFCKKYLKGFENSFITNICDMVGDRENGRVKSKYIYSIDDIKSGKIFKNNALCSNYPIDIHSDKKGKGGLEKVEKYYLPTKSLISFDFNNLYVVGRCLGADFKAQAALRVQQSCASMGEAVAHHIFNELKPH